MDTAAAQSTDLPREWPNPSPDPDVVIISPYVDHIAYGVRQLSSMARSRGFSTRLIFLPHLQPIQFLEYDFATPYSDVVLEQLADLCREVPFVGISMMSNNFFQAVQITRHLREHTDCRILWGGVHPTVRPEECLEFADYVCIGEGEEALVRFLELHRDGGDPAEAPNFCVLKNGELVKNEVLPLIEDLDALPLQDFTLEDHHVLARDGSGIVPVEFELFKEMALGGLTLGKGEAVLQVMSTRGCPHACAYCFNSWHKTLYRGQKQLRRRSVANVMHELEHFRSRFPFLGFVALTDDSFLSADWDWLVDFTTQYKERVGLPFFCLVSPVTLDEKKFELLLDAGLQIVEMGIQTGSSDALRRYNRRITNQQILEAAQLFNKYAHRFHPPTYDLIVDDPMGDYDEALDTIRLLARMPRPFVLHIYSMTLFPGTALYKRALKRGVLTEDQIEERVYRKISALSSDRYLYLLIKLFTRPYVPASLIALLATPPLRMAFDHSWFPKLVGGLRRLFRGLGWRAVRPVQAE
jgi:radical SAM superfamily enzyme YgiQ (UPF0313 family)